jgi:hypothetical protein
VLGGPATFDFIEWELVASAGDFAALPLDRPNPVRTEVEASAEKEVPGPPQSERQRVDDPSDHIPRMPRPEAHWCC